MHGCTAREAYERPRPSAYDMLTADYRARPLARGTARALARAHGLLGHDAARRRVRHRQVVPAAAGARLPRGRLRHLPRDARARAAAKAPEARLRAGRHAHARPPRRVRPRHLPRRRPQLPASGRRISTPRSRASSRNLRPRRNRDLGPQHARDVPVGVRHRPHDRPRRRVPRLARRDRRGPSSRAGRRRPPSRSSRPPPTGSGSGARACTANATGRPRMSTSSRGGRGCGSSPSTASTPAPCSSRSSTSLRTARRSTWPAGTTARIEEEVTRMSIGSI